MRDNNNIIIVQPEEKEYIYIGLTNISMNPISIVVMGSHERG